MLFGPTQSCCTTQMHHPSLMELLSAASIASLPLLWVAPTKHMLPFLGIPNTVKCHLWPAMCRFLQNNICLKDNTEFIMNFYLLILALLSATLFALDLKQSGTFILSLCTITPSVLICGVLFVLQLGLLDVTTLCMMKFLLSCGLPIISHIILSIRSSLISAIPSSAGPSPGTTKNQHLTHLPLYLNFTEHMPRWCISDWLYF